MKRAAASTRSAWHWDTTSEVRVRGEFWRRAGLGRAALLAGLMAATGASSWGQTSREEALAQVFPGADFQADTLFLTERQQTEAARMAGVPVPSRLIARYVARRNGAIVGRAYIDTHVVRTKNESLLVCLGPDGSVRRVEVTAFLEPPEYMGSELWYGQYEGGVLEDDLDLGRAIRPIAGATLTSRATAAAVRRVLAIDAVLGDRSGEAP